MGIEDRDYYWEDRKRRENKFKRSDSYYQKNEFKHTGSGKPANAPRAKGNWWSWIKAKKIDAYSFLSGFIFAFLLISFFVNLTPGFVDFLSKPARGFLHFLGIGFN